MANETQSPQVVQIALAAAFDNRQNVIGIPQRAAGETLKSPSFEQLEAMHAAGSLQFGKGGFGVEAAGFADAPIARENLIAKIAWIGAKFPLMDAEVGAEGEAPRGWDFEVAPAAKRSSVGAFFQGGAIGEPTGHGAGGGQTFLF
jgi:hypothetical protein